MNPTIWSRFTPNGIQDTNTGHSQRESGIEIHFSGSGFRKKASFLFRQINTPYVYPYPLTCRATICILVFVIFNVHDDQGKHTPN